MDEVYVLYFANPYRDGEQHLGIFSTRDKAYDYAGKYVNCNNCYNLDDFVVINEVLNPLFPS